MPTGPALYALLGLAVLTPVVLARPLTRSRLRPPSHLRTLWLLFLFLSLSEWVSFTLAIWLLGAFFFSCLREYFSLVDIRLQDRWGILAAYLCVPFVVTLIQIDWYGLFVISIPVYAFVVVPFLVAAGGRDPRGTVFSIGAVDFGLFLFVYCTGHIGYLARFSTWLAILLVSAVAISDLADRYGPGGGGGRLRAAPGKLLIAAPAAVGLSALIAGPAGLPISHAVALGLLIPVLVLMGNFTWVAIEADLGIAPDRLEPGRGRIVDAVKPYLFAGPVTFHYLRYFTEIF